MSRDIFQNFKAIFTTSSGPFNLSNNSFEKIEIGLKSVTYYLHGISIKLQMLTNEHLKNKEFVARLIVQYET